MRFNKISLKILLPLMGGDLTVSSAVGKGSIFRFDIPIELVEAPEVSPTQPARQIIGLALGQPVYRLLIAEDIEANCRLLVKLLYPLGFELREAENGQEALALWESWQPHLIWLDIEMPIMDGREVMQRIKATPQGQETIIIVLTASAFEEERTEILRFGCDDFVRKPFREEEIFEMLHKHLDVRFVYEEKEQVAGRRSQVTGEGMLTPEALAVLPAEWLSDLRQGAEEADLNLLLSVLEQIHERDAALADALAQLVDDFEYDEILVLLQQIKDENSNQ